MAELCCFQQEPDGKYSSRKMLENNLKAEQAILNLISRQASLAESLGDGGTRYLYEQILLKTEERAYHLDHFLAKDSLTLGFIKSA